MKTIDHLHSLRPRQFESLTYDLLLLEGMRNLVWRTPGTDGGRDLQGERDSVDLSGARTVEHWYVECKRHARTVDWPTIDAKRAYARNHQADFLLIVTTGWLSPTCKSELDQHNKRKELPRLRFWEGHTLANYVDRHELLKSKYGFGANDTSLAVAALPVLRLAQKIAQQVYGALEAGSDATPSSEACASLLEMVVVRVDMWKAGTHQISRWRDEDAYPWLAVDPAVLIGFDSLGLRALLAFVRYATKQATLSLIGADAGRLAIACEASRLSDGALALIMQWSHLEIEKDGQFLRIRARPIP